MRAKRLPSPLELADKVIGPLSCQCRPEFRLLQAARQVTEAGSDLEDLLLERRELLVRGRLGVAQRTLAGKHPDLGLLSLLKESADPNQLLPQLRFLLALPLNRLGCRSQRAGGLRRRGAGGIDPRRNRLPFGRKRGSNRGQLLDILGSPKRRVPLTLQRLLGLANPGLDLEQRVRGPPASIRDGRQDLPAGSHGPQLGMAFYN